MVGEVRDPETAGICLPRRADRSLRPLHHSHERFALRRQPAGRHGDRTLLVGLNASRVGGAAAHPTALQGLQGDLRMQPRIRRKLHGLEPGQKLYRPKGCDKCRGTGYKGRIGVFEVVRITPRMASLIQSRTPLPELRAAAREQGMKLLIDSGMDKVRDGFTSLEEVLTVATGEDD